MPRIIVKTFLRIDEDSGICRPRLPFPITSWTVIHEGEDVTYRMNKFRGKEVMAAVTYRPKYQDKVDGFADRHPEDIVELRKSADYRRHWRRTNAEELAERYTDFSYPLSAQEINRGRLNRTRYITVPYEGEDKDRLTLFTRRRRNG